MEATIRATAQGIWWLESVAKHYQTATRESGASMSWSFVVDEPSPVSD
jgi:hypothetical protein